MVISEGSTMVGLPDNLPQAVLRFHQNLIFFAFSSASRSSSSGLREIGESPGNTFESSTGKRNEPGLRFFKSILSWAYLFEDLAYIKSLLLPSNLTTVMALLGVILMLGEVLIYSTGNSMFRLI